VSLSMSVCECVCLRVCVTVHLCDCACVCMYACVRACAPARLRCMHHQCHRPITQKDVCLDCIHKGTVDAHKRGLHIFW